MAPEVSEMPKELREREWGTHPGLRPGSGPRAELTDLLCPPQVWKFLRVFI